MTEAGSTTQTIRRRTTRVRTRLPVLITSLAASTPFSLICETLLVNAHGCDVKVPQPLATGTPVRLRIAPGSSSRGNTPGEFLEARAQVVSCQPMEDSQSNWLAGIKLDTPGNLWGLAPAPEDWMHYDGGTGAPSGPAAAPEIELDMPVWSLSTPATKITAPAWTGDDAIEQQLAAQQEKIAALENRVAQSLASLEQRLSAFESFPNAVWRELADAQQQTRIEVRQQIDTALSDQLRPLHERRIQKAIATAVEQALGQTSAEISARLAREAEILHEKIIPLLDALQKESVRCQTQADGLLDEKNSIDDWRRQRLAEFQRTLHETILEASGQIRGRTQMALEMITEPVEQLRDRAAQQLNEQAVRQARQLREDTDELTERLRAMRRDLENTVRESIESQARETAEAFSHKIAQTAQQCVEEWRSALARNLEALSGSLAQKLPTGEQ